MNALSLDWELMLDNLLRIGAAYVLAFPVAWEREKAEKSAGLRTFPLVAVASAGFVLTGARLADSTPESVSRVIQGLMTGIGFIGGGTILKAKNDRVHGTATAASVWSTGAIGAAAALGRFEIAILLSAITFATLHLLKPLKRSINGEHEPGPEKKEPEAAREREDRDGEDRSD